jgi:hypothetical protein
VADNSVYPGSIDSFGTVENNVDYVEAKHVNQLNDAINKIETELGTNPSGSFDDVKTRLDSLNIGNLSDVNISNPANYQTLIYDETSSKWENAEISADMISDGATKVIITATQETNFETAYTHSQTSGNPHGTTAAQVSAISNTDDAVKRNHIDWGTSTNQVSLDDVPNGATSKLGQDCSATGSPSFEQIGLNRIPRLNVLLHMAPETGDTPFCIEKPSGGAWWNQSWDYKREFTIANSGSTLTNFQVLININTASLVTAGKMQSNCADLRILNSAQDTLLDFWLDTSTANTASTDIWVKIPSLAAGNTTIYLYYGNSMASSVSSGDNTFDFFDDFNNSSYTDKWVVVSGTWAESGGVLAVSTMETPANIKLLNEITLTDYVIDVKAKKTGGREGFLVTFKVGTYLPWWNLGGWSNTRSIVQSIDGTSVDIGYVGAGNLVQQWDVTDTTVGNPGDQNSNKTALGTWSTSAEYDDYRIRKYAATEPTVTVGTEYARVALKMQVDENGVITEAVWQGSPIGVAWGGTGLSAKVFGNDLQGLSVIPNSTNPAYQADINADYLQVEDYNLSGIDITVDITQNGANGLDTGSEAANTWYSLWVIYKPTTNTTAGLISISASSPTMPSGYAKKRLIGWVRNDASSNFTDPPINLSDKYQWRGDPASVDKTESDLSVTTTWTDLDLSAIIPPGVKTINLICSLTGSAGSMLKFRRNGQTGDKSVAVISASVDSVSVFEDLITTCDSNRVIEYYRTGGISAATLTVKGWWM